MSEVKTIKFEPFHLEVIEAREEALDVLEYVDATIGRIALGEYLQSIPTTYKNAKPAIGTFTVDDHVAGICGLMKTDKPGVCEATMYLSPLAKRCAKSLVKVIRDYIANSQYERLQAYVDVEDKLAVRFIEVVGFKREGLMRKFGLGLKDQYSYSIVRD